MSGTAQYDLRLACGHAKWIGPALNVSHGQVNCPVCNRPSAVIDAQPGHFIFGQMAKEWQMTMDEWHDHQPCTPNRAPENSLRRSPDLSYLDWDR